MKGIHWAEERYTRLYCASPPSWCALSWRAQALYPQIRRRLDRAGVLSLDSLSPAEAVGLMLPHWPVNVVRRGVVELVRRGWFVHLPEALDGMGCLVDPDFEESESSGSSDRQRQRASRARRRDKLRAESILPVSSQAATKRHSVQSGPVRSCPVPPNPPPPGARERGDRRRFVEVVQRTMAEATGRDVGTNAVGEREIGGWWEDGIPVGIVVDVVREIVTPTIRHPVGYVRREVRHRWALLGRPSSIEPPEPLPLPLPEPEPIRSETWNRLREALRLRLHAEEFAVWITPIVPISEDTASLTLLVPNEHFQHTLESTGWVQETARRFDKTIRWSTREMES